jgi:hypothetical protein
MYENYFPKTNSNVIGYAAYSNQDKDLVHLAYIDYQKAFEVAKGIRVGVFTGRYAERGSQTFYQIEFESYLKDDSGAIHRFGYVDRDVFYAEKIRQKTGTNAMMQELINNNKTILENNLLCAALIDKIDVANMDIPNEYRSRLVGLQTNLQARDKHISDSVFLDKKQTASPTGFDKYSPQLTNFMADPGISIPPVVIYIIVSVVFGILLSGIVYLLFKSDHSQSKTDISYSKDLTSILLKKLTPEEYQQLVTENKENAQRIADAASGNSFLNTAKYLGIGFLGFTLIDKFIQNRPTK